MKKEIWKYAITPNQKHLILPLDAEILAVQTQNNEPFIWCLVDPNEELESRYFEIYGTGHQIHYDMGTERKYIGTFQLNNGDLVFHLFERIN